ncbi:MAG: T9SS type A sorting domain-containing protein [bacterium]|nr:T9SS type A sorting domain-containing protein [bacterium]
MKHNYHSRKVRQLDRLIKEMKQAMKARQPKALVDRFRQKIAWLIKELRGILSTRQLAHKLGALAIVFGFANTSNAQQFAAPVENPFGFQIDSTSYIGGFGVADLDGDGDFDLLMGGSYGEIKYYENTGTADSPAFGASQTNPFGLTSTYYYAFITTADLDDDGDIDILVGEYYGDLVYFENTGTSTAPAFAAAQANPFGLNTGSSLLDMPSFVDLDDDGDFDIISCSIVYAGGPGMVYYENTGTASSPAFAAQVTDPFGITANAAYFQNPTMADIDGDGDFDLLTAENYGTFAFYENTGTVSAPAFAAPQVNPFGLVDNVTDFVFPEFVDIDDDGDFDVLGSGYYGSLWFFENTQFNVGIDELANNVSMGPNPFVSEVHFTTDAQVDLVEVLDMTGKLVYSEVSPKGSLNLSSLKAGVYMIQVVDSEGKVSRQKLEKQ